MSGWTRPPAKRILTSSWRNRQNSKSVWLVFTKALMEFHTKSDKPTVGYKSKSDKPTVDWKRYGCAVPGSLLHSFICVATLPSLYVPPPCLACPSAYPGPAWQMLLGRGEEGQQTSICWSLLSVNDPGRSVKCHFQVLVSRQSENNNSRPIIPS